MRKSLSTPLRLRFRNLRYGFLFWPGLIALGFVGTAALILTIEKAAGPNGVAFVFDGDASAARSILGTIATSLITVAGVAFSITIVTLQLVSQQFSPRALRNFLGDRVNQMMAGVFVGIFAYCLVMLSSVRGAQEAAREGFVPALGVTLGIVLAFVALGVLLIFIHHMSQSIQVSHIAASVASSTMSSLGGIYPEPFAEPAGEDVPERLDRWRRDGTPVIVKAERSGYVQSIALDGVPDSLGEEGVRVHFPVAPGRFVRIDEPIAAVWRSSSDDPARAVHRLVVVASEREVRHDTLYGIRQLADIAMRAISPSINDPTTAAECIGYMRAVLVRLAGRSFPARVRRYGDRDLEVIAERHDFGDFVDTALVEVGRYASSDGRIVSALLETAVAAAHAARDCGALDRVLALREAGRTIAEPARQGLPNERDRAQLERLMADLERIAREEAPA